MDKGDRTPAAYYEDHTERFCGWGTLQTNFNTTIQKKALILFPFPSSGLLSGFEN